MSDIIFRNANLFDGAGHTLLEGYDVYVEGGLIREVSDRPLPSATAESVDCAGRTLMPGMIDAHVHTYAANIGSGQGTRLGATYVAHYASNFLRHALDNGFTTVRDVGGGDRGLAIAIRDGLLPSPRLFFGGRIISQTAGHGDFRSADSAAGHGSACGCTIQSDLGSAIADGADQVRGAVREELRRGASHIKIMGSGGVGSPSDPIDRCQFSDDEIRVAVEETMRWGVYVAAHCHPTQAIRRCIELGVRSIEHATLIDHETALLSIERGAFLVPTLSVIFALMKDGLAVGLPAASIEKLKHIGEHALSGLEIMRNAGAQIGFGTDLIGPLYLRRGTEFTLRREVLTSVEILKSACAGNAKLLMQEGRLGCIAPGACADILVVDGNPIADISLLARGGETLSVIMKDGRFHKRLI